jgi:DNA-binding transcriptional regulator YdaS (Cro superfamily)
MDSVKTLIDKATSKCGTRYKLAKMLHVAPANVYQWETGAKTCPNEVRALIAQIAGDDPIQELVRATIENAKGERQEQLRQILGKQLHQTGAVLHTVAISIFSLAFLTEAGKSLYTMYIMLS